MERESKDDGLVQRFLVCCPQPGFYTATEINSSPPLTFSIELVFMFIKLNHSEPDNHINLTEEATDKFKEYFNEFREIVKLANQNSTFLRWV